VAKRTKTKLAGMDFQGLLDLREQVEGALSSYRATLEEQLASIGGSIASVGRRKMTGGGRGSLKGRKVKPKYKSPDGITWAGRGATPLWLEEAIKSGKTREDFLIDKSTAKATKTAKKRRKSKR
jgi:DNA-binding protein H-NS